MSFFEIARQPLSRTAGRAFMGQSGALLSASTVALLAGCQTRAVAADRSDSHATANDVNILNSALGAEHEGIAAYQVGAESGLLQKSALDLAVQFQGHHKAHADLLAATIRKLGGRPVEPKA